MPRATQLAGIRNVILVGAAAPVTFFAYPGKPQRPYPQDAVVHTLARAEQDSPDALARLADELDAPRVDAAGLEAADAWHCQRVRSHPKRSRRL